MAELKTKLNDASVHDFLNSIQDEKKRKDSNTIVDLIKQVTRSEPKMWGKSIIGFGIYHYKYKSSREGDWMKVGFSPRKENLTLYIMPGFDKYENLMQNLGKHKTGKGCLYIKKLEDVNLDILEKLITQSFKYISEKYDKL